MNEYGLILLDKRIVNYYNSNVKQMQFLNHSKEVL